MSQLIMFQSGGFTNYGICYRKYSLDELKEIAMQEETKTRTNPKETEENVSKRTVRLHTGKSKYQRTIMNVLRLAGMVEHCDGIN